MNLKQAIFLEYTELQLFCSYTLYDTCHVIFHIDCFVLTLALPALRVQCPMWLFYILP